MTAGSVAPIEKNFVVSVRSVAGSRVAMFLETSDSNFEMRGTYQPLAATQRCARRMMNEDSATL